MQVKSTTFVGSISDRAFVSQPFANNPSICHILYAATLHNPYVDLHGKLDFIETKVTETLVLLEEAVGPDNPVRMKPFVSSEPRLASEAH